MADTELGIQAIYKVYQRAFLSIGLLRTRIESQRTLDALPWGYIGWHGSSKRDEASKRRLSREMGLFRS